MTISVRGSGMPRLPVEIDGVLLPLRARPAGTSHLVIGGAVAASDGSGNPLLDRLDPGDGPRLGGLRGDLVWASTWMAEAIEGDRASAWSSRAAVR
ncbi:hypothetical protein ACQP0I_06780 [Micromonospora carbonacea]|uniref:hypothetical protein n=1 Tax=Micromonospora carbonacea TaxID=47853 RepID=UPI003D95C627